jgi:hypothetical protein
VVVDTRERHAPFPDRIRQHPQPAQLGDIEHDDHVGAADLFDRFGCPVHPGQLVEQEAEARGSRGGIGHAHRHPAREQQVGQCCFAAESVTVGIDVGGEADPLPRVEECGERFGGSHLLGRKRRHGR